VASLKPHLILNIPKHCPGVNKLTDSLAYCWYRICLFFFSRGYDSLKLHFN